MRIGKLAFALISVLSIPLLVSGILYWNHSQQNSLPFKPLPLIDFDKQYLTSKVINLTQNTDFLVNLTITSTADKKLEIPFSLELYSIFREGVQDLNPEVSGFDYWFEPSSIVLEPSGSNSTLLTVRFSPDADTVEYDFRVQFGKSDAHHVGGTVLRIEVCS
jgi:hypothetical protein